MCSFVKMSTTQNKVWKLISVVSPLSVVKLSMLCCGSVRDSRPMIAEMRSSPYTVRWKQSGHRAIKVRYCVFHYPPFIMKTLKLKMLKLYNPEAPDVCFPLKWRVLITLVIMLLFFIDTCSCFVVKVKSVQSALLIWEHIWVCLSLCLLLHLRKPDTWCSRKHTHKETYKRGMVPRCTELKQNSNTQFKRQLHSSSFSFMRWTAPCSDVTEQKCAWKVETRWRKWLSGHVIQRSLICRPTCPWILCSIAPGFHGNRVKQGARVRMCEEERMRVCRWESAHSLQSSLHF